MNTHDIGEFLKVRDNCLKGVLSALPATSETTGCACMPFIVPPEEEKTDEPYVLPEDKQEQYNANDDTDDIKFDAHDKDANNGAQNKDANIGARDNDEKNGGVVPEGQKLKRSKNTNTNNVPHNGLPPSKSLVTKGGTSRKKNRLGARVLSRMFSRGKSKRSLKLETIQEEKATIIAEDATAKRTSIITKKDIEVSKRSRTGAKKDNTQSKQSSTVAKNDNAKSERRYTVANKVSAKSKRNSGVVNKDDAKSKQNSTVANKDSAKSNRNSSVPNKDSAKSTRNFIVDNKDDAKSNRNSAVNNKDDANSKRNNTVTKNDNENSKPNSAVVEELNVKSQQNCIVAMDDNVVKAQNDDIAAMADGTKAENDIPGSREPKANTHMDNSKLEAFLALVEIDTEERTVPIVYSMCGNRTRSSTISVVEAQDGEETMSEETIEEVKQLLSILNQAERLGVSRRNLVQSLRDDDGLSICRSLVSKDDASDEEYSDDESLEPHNFTTQEPPKKITAEEVLEMLEDFTAEELLQMLQLHAREGAARLAKTSAIYTVKQMLLIIEDQAERLGVSRHHLVRSIMDDGGQSIGRRLGTKDDGKNEVCERLEPHNKTAEELVEVLQDFAPEERSSKKSALTKDTDTPFLLCT